MAHMLHRRAANKPAIFLATPSYGGIEPGYVFALFESVKALEAEGIRTELAIFAGDCHVDDARNRLVKEFLETDCTHLLFLDADVRWEAKDLLRLISYDKDVVGGTYPLKQEEEGYPVMLGDARVEGDLLEVEALPTGFLKISRRALKTLALAAPKYFGKKDPEPTPLIFERTIVGTTRWGGDTTFCRKWRETGGEIYLDPVPVMEHTGNRTWSGCFQDFYRASQVGAIPAAIEAIREGRCSANTFIKAYKDAGNPYAASPLFYMTLLQAKGRVLECGSGLSTLYMAVNGCEVYCLEHDAQWAKDLIAKAELYLTDEEQSRIHIVRSDLVDGWYSVTPDGDFDSLVVDGPPPTLGDRAGVERVLPQVHGLVICDDGFKALPLEFQKIDDRVNVARAM